MAELNLNQIEDKLNEEFTGDIRKIVFWYDDNTEFIDDIDSLELENAKIHKLAKNNLFQTKVMLERKDKESNYLIYAPFPKPNSKANHLADTIKYSKEFSADRASLLAVDLGIHDKYKPVLQKYIKFFGAKARTKKFYDLEVDYYNENIIEVSIMSVLVGAKVSNFEEVVRIILTTGELKENRYLEEFRKYDLEEAFWKNISHTFSFADEEPNLEKFLISLFLTYTDKEISSELPGNLSKYLLNKSGTVMTFMDQIMNSMLYREQFDLLAEKVFATIDGKKIFGDYQVEEVIDLDIFKFIDKKIINWMVDRLLDENLNSSIDDMAIPELCRHRESLHFGDLYFDDYHVLRHAYYVMDNVNYEPSSDLLSIIEDYNKRDYIIDTHYRKFYYYLDRLENKHIFDDLQEIVENIYTNKFLDVLSNKFNKEFSYEGVKGRYKLQREFYKNFIEGTKGSTVVIISDAFRYELGKELVKRMKREKKFETVDIEPQIGVLPSYTSLGMASLLPNEQITIDEDYDVFVDGKASKNLEQREAILKNKIEDSGSINYDDLKKYNQEEMRDFFSGKRVVYIYHDQIDARSDGGGSEDEVFMACKESIEEIENLMVRLTNAVSRTRYIVTADHGFIYKRNKTVESDKIDRFFVKEDQIGKRSILSEKEYDVIGTKKILISDVLGGYDDRTVTTPMGSNIFKSAGGGQNFVHGGSSPQEILVPVVEVRTIRGYKESENVKIALISMLPTVTSLSISLDFIQQEPLSDVVNPTSYKISFVDENNEPISNEEIHLANSKAESSAGRIFKLKFNLKDQKYDRDKKYYLTGVDTETGIELFRHEVVMDIAFAGGFGFDL